MNKVNESKCVSTGVYTLFRKIVLAIPHNSFKNFSMAAE